MIEPNYRGTKRRLDARNEAFEKLLAEIRGVDELSTKCLLDTEHLSLSELKLIFKIAKAFKEEFTSRPIKNIPLLNGKSVINIFDKKDTTSIAYELAAKQFDADLINFFAEDENLPSTVQSIDALNADLIIIKSRSSGSAQKASKKANCSVINAGDGIHANPAAALADLYTIHEKKGRVAGQKVLLVGDCLNSQAALSLIKVLIKMKADARLCAPPTLIPPDVENLGIRIYHDLDRAVKDADVIYVLGIGKEAVEKNLVPSIKEYLRFFGVSTQRLKLAKPDTILMQEGAVRKMIGVQEETLSSEQSAAAQQVNNLLVLSMTLLYLLLKKDVEPKLQRRLR
jgi:aspartate carbamoyltransferase catalytic subunit